MYIFSIKNIRKSKQISLNKLHKITGISRSYLFDLENNRRFNPTLEMLEKIALALDTDIKDLFYSLNEIEKLKEDLYIKIEKYGIHSNEVLEASQIIDLLINIKMKED